MTGTVTLVIPCRNAERFLHACLDALLPILETDELEEVIVVDDGSTDSTPEILAQYPVRVIRGEGKGAAAARNLGWREAKTPLIWFVDADCVASPDALALLLPHLEDPEVGGVGGSYDNMVPESLLGTLIHEEILVRHRRMPSEVNVLATFDVVYRRSVLEEINGFDPTCFWAHDAELAFRVRKAGHRLRFEPRSRVGHFHPIRWLSYLRKQGKQGFYRVLLYLRHPQRMGGDSYTALSDVMQPPLAMLVIASLPLLLLSGWRWVPLALSLALMMLHSSITWNILRHTGKLSLVSFTWMSFVRSFYRGIGMTLGVLCCCLRRDLWRSNSTQEHVD